MEWVKNPRVMGVAAIFLGILAAAWPWFLSVNLMKTLGTITGSLVIVVAIFIFTVLARKPVERTPE